ncbi:MAG: sugar ABC transporter substrate-binding protein [Caldilineaceae bacterium]|nr:sugar ABC transporter substrate-binding protein [Caldilineaceae bacterium]
MKRKLTRREVLTSMAGLSGLALVSGCVQALPSSATTPAAGDAEQAPGQEAVTLRVFFGANPEEATTRQTIFDQFTEAHPNIKITPEIPTQNTTEALLVQVAGGAPPDVVMAWELQYPILAEKGVYMELSPLISADLEYQDNVLTDFYQSHIDMYTWKGELYVLPEQNAAVVCYYNKDMFDEAGVAYPPSDWSDTSWTWDTFLDACQKLTKKEGDEIVQYAWTEAWWPPLSAVIFAYNNGGDWFDRYQDPTKVTMTNPEVVQAFQFYSDLWNSEGVATNPEQWEVQAGYQMFAAKKAAMTLVGHWFYPEFSKEEHGLNMDIGVFPIGPNGTTSKTDLGGTGMAITKLTKYPEAAWEFLRFECGPEGQRVIARSGLFAPTLQSVANSDDFLGSHSAIENAAVFNTAMENAVSFPIGPAWDAMADRLGRNLDALWQGDTTADEALAQAEVEMQQALDETLAG